jgi:hypothetical protein
MRLRKNKHQTTHAIGARFSIFQGEDSHTRCGQANNSTTGDQARIGREFNARIFGS